MGHCVISKFSLSITAKLMLIEPMDFRGKSGKHANEGMNE